MTKRNVQVKLENGLDARPIAHLVQEASKYDSTIYIIAEGKRINAKSIMGMMSLALDSGEDLEVSADGQDEQEAVEGIENFLSGKAVAVKC
ncbi:MAG: HPr family phosphocarrier protein [Eubacterium sp.]|nr:HPr family phosphocarrier protein [Eubacterium sp.]MCM1213868.1 HPr family phosphocarrier protein [Lachnospiraceae bacterium]MCM1303263.1 HPr family phosphocarrier protein [Butyrivibrio sp.]MCM1343150.1 HPr family phosphocarrier protein [Muribaculaceae bacterium]MCM1240129.1 HPr family phosphocarrier protein [Lachnospiraceae bacterium]